METVGAGLPSTDASVEFVFGIGFSHFHLANFYESLFGYESKPYSYIPNSIHLRHLFVFHSHTHSHSFNFNIFFTAERERLIKIEIYYYTYAQNARNTHTCTLDTQTSTLSQTCVHECFVLHSMKRILAASGNLFSTLICSSFAFDIGPSPGETGERGGGGEGMLYCKSVSVLVCWTKSVCCEFVHKIAHR